MEAQAQQQPLVPLRELQPGQLHSGQEPSPPEHWEQLLEPPNSQAQPLEQASRYRNSRCSAQAQPLELVRASNSCIRPTSSSP